MIKHFCDRCGAEIIKCDLELIEAPKSKFEQALSDAAEALKKIFGRPEVKIPEKPFHFQLFLESGEETRNEAVELCDECRVAFRSWWEAGQTMEIPKEPEEVNK